MFLRGFHQRCLSDSQWVLFFFCLHAPSLTTKAPVFSVKILSPLCRAVETLHGGLVLLVLLIPGDAFADVVINEIMFHPAHAVETVEPVGEEFIELRNTDAANAASLGGWSFSSGVQFTFSVVSIPPGGYLVVAADPVSFASKHPGVTATVLGPWTGRLSNAGEKVRLVDSGGSQIDEVVYTDDGDWALRRRGPLDNGHRGWVYTTAADGEGSSLELVNPALSNKQGQNWAASAVTDGTPGAANSVAAPDIAPMILNVKHSPALPTSSDLVRIRADLVDESTNNLSAAVHYRVSTLSPGAFVALPMFDDGLHADGAAGDKTFGAFLPAHANGTILEFYVSASDGVRTRTWPGATDAGGTQGANALYLVEDNPVLSSTATYRLVLSASEDDEFAFSNFNSDSNAQMNATFIATRGSDNDIRYGLGVRRRGNGSRNDNPRTLRAKIPADRDWDGNTGMNLNAKYTYMQVFGQRIFAAACMASEQGRQVKLVMNGIDQGDPGALGYGFYSHMEPQDSESIARQFPDDSSGNLYRKRRPSTDLAYRGGDVSAYLADGWSKDTNVSQWDWTDLDGMLDAINDTGSPDYLSNLSARIDVDQWLRYFAIMALLNNGETNISNGTDDDYYTYRGVIDPRFKLLPHDCDTILGVGDGDAITDPQHTIYDMFESGSTIPSLENFVKHPNVLPRYHAQLRDLIDTVFAKPDFDALVDEMLGRVPPGIRASVKSLMDQRRAYVRSIVDPPLTVQSGLPVVGGFPQATVPNVSLDGTVNIIDAAIVRVNGAQAVLDPLTATWALGSAQSQTIVPRGSVWKYLDDGTNQGTAWRAGGFGDSAWASGPAKLGYGEGDEATVIGFGGNTNNRHVTSYFRTQFTVVNPALFTGLQLLLKRDDGAAVYLNGTEIVRDNLPAAAGYTDLATNTVGGSDETTFFSFSVDPGMLAAGTNTLAVEVHQVAVDSSDVSFDLELNGLLASSGTTLVPGINRVIVQAFDGLGNENERQSIDVWYDDGNTQSISGTFATSTLTAAGGPYVVTADAMVPVGATLMIEPGTNLYFAAGTRLTVLGKLLAEGTLYRQLRFTRLPGSTDTWAGVYFSNTLEDNVLSYAVQDYSSSASHSTEVTDSRLVLDHVTWEGTTETVIEVDHPELKVLGCHFPPTSGQEVIHGANLSGADYFILDGCYFNSSSGYNDIIDFTGGRRPGPIIQVRNNIFNGGTDDCLDLDGIDAHIEGNIFRNIHTDDPLRPSTSNGIATDADAHLTVVRNIFDNVDHALLLKNDADAIFENNVVIGATLGAVNFNEPLRTVDAGSHVVARGNIFMNNAVTFRHPTHLDGSGNPPVITANNNIMPSAEHGYGTGNIDLDPAFADAAGGDFSLLPGSPARGTGINGANLGAGISAGALLSGAPPAITHANSATLTVYVPGISGIDNGSFTSEYRWRVNGGAWSAPTDAGLPISLTDLVDGGYTVEVVAKDSAGVWQEFADASAVSWTVNAAHARLRINEVLADNVSAFDNASSHPDVIELYNDSATVLDIGGMALTDDPAVPQKFVFPIATIIPAGGYLLVLADSEFALAGIHTGFALDAGGETLSLYALDGTTLLDSVSFGTQIPDCSIGRTGPTAEWELNAPTLGAANVRKGTGDPRRLSINEWLASNSVLYCDDFIELFNQGLDPVALGGHYLTDDPGVDKTRYRIPELSYIAAGGFRVFWADATPLLGANHLNFQLNGNVEWIGLYSPDVDAIDLVPFDSQIADVSQGRLPDGALTISTFALPTAGITNAQIAGGGSVTTPLIGITDVWAYDQTSAYPNAAWRGPEFNDAAWPTGGGLLYVEGSTLPAPKTTLLSLGRTTYYFRKSFTFTGNPAQTSLSLQKVVDDGVILYLNGQELHRIRVTGTPSYGTFADSPSVDNAVYEGPFTVPSTALVNGVNVIAAEVHQQSAGSSDVVFGVALDAVVTTPPVANPAYEKARKLITGLRVTEIMYNPTRGSNYEFIELQNVGSDTLDLTGVRFTTGIQFEFPSMSLAPGGFVLVVSSAAFLDELVLAGHTVAGVYTGKLDNAGEEVVLQLPLPYDANIQKFTYDDKWYPLSDGSGYSLEIRDSSAPVADWDKTSAWRIGALQGSPGSNLSLFAGVAQIATLPAGMVNLDASAIGNWSPTALWTQVSGPATVDFGNASAIDTPASFPLPGTYGLRITGTEAAFSLQSEVVITINDTYAAWAARNNVTGGPLDDDDGDEVDNFTEYGFDLNPHLSDGDRLPDLSILGPELVLEYLAYLRKTDVELVVESSGNLVDWSDEFSVFVSGLPDEETLRYTIGLAASNRRFVRVSIRPRL